MIKKLILITALTGITGCASYNPSTRQWSPGVTQVGPYKVGLQPSQPVQEIVGNPAGYIEEQISGYATSVLGETITDPFALAVRVNTFILGAFGPNQVSTALNKGINMYRVGNGVLNNPLEAAFIYTTPWIKK